MSLQSSLVQTVKEFDWEKKRVIKKKDPVLESSRSCSRRWHWRRWRRPVWRRRARSAAPGRRPASSASAAERRRPRATTGRSIGGSCSSKKQTNKQTKKQITLGHSVSFLDMNLGQLVGHIEEYFFLNHRVTRSAAAEMANGERRRKSVLVFQSVDFDAKVTWIRTGILASTWTVEFQLSRVRRIVGPRKKKQSYPVKTYSVWIKLISGPRRKSENSAKGISTWLKPSKTHRKSHLAQLEMAE